MPFDRIFDTDAEFDEAQGNGELALGEIYLINDGSPTVRFALGASESTAIPTDGSNGNFNDVQAENIIYAGGQFQVDGLKVVGNRAGPVSNPTGGSVVDAQCRAALADLLAILRPAGHGLISNS